MKYSWTAGHGIKCCNKPTSATSQRHYEIGTHVPVVRPGNRDSEKWLVPDHTAKQAAVEGSKQVPIGTDTRFNRCTVPAAGVTSPSRQDTAVWRRVL